MSLIFDALQRSEAERSGVEVSSLSVATEVLQRAELHAASEREAVIQFEQPVAPRRADRHSRSKECREPRPQRTFPDQTSLSMTSTRSVS